MSDDPRELEPSKLWLRVGDVLAAANETGAPPDFAPTPLTITATKPLVRAVQRLRGGSGTQLAYQLELQTDKPSLFEVTYRERKVSPARSDNIAWALDDGIHAAVETQSKTLTVSVWIDGRAAAVQRMLVESPFMEHAHVFATESKLGRLDYGWHLDGGMTSTIEGEWRGSEEDDDDRRLRLGFALYDDKAGRELTPAEIEAVMDPTRRLRAGVVYRDLEHDARMEPRGAVTLEVRYGVAARPTVRKRA